MLILKKKNLIKIPENLIVLYSEKNETLTLISFLKKQTIKLPVKIFILTDKNFIYITDSTFSKTSLIKKNSKAFQGTTISKIKNVILEINYILYFKLHLVGVGYRAFEFDSDKRSQLFFKLGYSHLVYYKIPKSFSSFCKKFTKLFIFGNVSYSDLKQLAANIREQKIPEPYKGKGILLEGEQINLKKGKKI